MSPESIGILVFILALLAVVYWKRKHLQVQKILFPVVYVLMWKTKLGLRLMDSWAKKRGLRAAGYLSIAIGFLGMVLIVYGLVDSLIRYFTSPAAVAGVGLVLPIKAKGIFYVPFFYWIICIFILAIVHEFAHGVYARLCNIKVHSSGFALFSVIVPIIPAAFVEPDEKQIVKKKVSEQLMVYSAGPFANVITALVAVLVLIFVFTPLTNHINIPDGVELASVSEGQPAAIAGLVRGDKITSIGDTPISTTAEFSATLASHVPGDAITITTNYSVHTVTLAPHPSDASKPYLGVSVVQSTEINQSFAERYGQYAPSIVLWLSGLFFWLYLLNLGIGLFNLAPLGPLDGGRMVLATLQQWMPDARAKKIWGAISSFVLLLLIANIITAFL